MRPAFAVLLLAVPLSAAGAVCQPITIADGYAMPRAALESRVCDYRASADAMLKASKPDQAAQCLSVSMDGEKTFRERFKVPSRCWRDPPQPAPPTK